MIDNYTHLAKPDDKYPNNHRAYIYTLSDDSGVRYIGQSINPHTRFLDHKYNYRNGKNKTSRGIWLKSLYDNGTDPVLAIIEMCHGSISNQRERHWINHYLEQGASLVNSSRSNVILGAEELTFIQSRYGGDKSRAIHDGLKLLMSQ